MHFATRLLSAAATLAVVTPACAQAGAATEAPEAEQQEEIVVTAPFRKSSAETILPVHVLSDEELRRQVGNSLGDTLKGLVGVHNTSFGPGVGHAVIRGQSGKRVQVLQNGVGNVDASAISPDHAHGVEPSQASRIEVIRGPATLLYGNGAIGGVVNLIDDRIAETPYEHLEFSVSQHHATNGSENRSLIGLKAPAGAFNFYAEGLVRDNDEVEIDGLAMAAAALVADDHDDDDDHDDEHGADEHDDDEHDDDEIGPHGIIANSQAEAQNFGFGASLVGERGFVGFSISELQTEYGVPPGAHGHGHEEEGDHEEGEGAHEDEDEHEEEGEELLVRIDLEQTRYDLKGGWNFAGGFFEALRAEMQFTDYQHGELEIEAGQAPQVGTLYSNEGVESRFTLTHAPVGPQNSWTGVWGAQLTDTEFSATGEEAFIPRTEISGLALFAVERYQRQRANWEFGLRFEQLDLNPGGNCARDETALSLSAGLLYDLADNTNLLVGISRSERAPTTEERYSNIEVAGCAQKADPEDLVLHAATGTIERGNPDLGKESATNIEFSYRKHSGAWRLEAGLYYNSIADYIYLADSGEEFEEQEITDYRAEDANFSGFEAALEYRLATEPGNLDLRVYSDMVRAEFDSGGKVPRIPPMRIGAGLSFSTDRWYWDLSLTEVSDQKDTAVGETATDGYSLLDFYTEYRLPAGDGELRLSARGTNLLDEQIRNHTSFLKDQAPEPGINLKLGINYRY